MDIKSVMSFKFKQSSSATHCFKNVLNESNSVVFNLKSPSLFTKNHVYQFLLFYDSKILSFKNKIFAVVQNITSKLINVIIKISIINSDNKKCNTKEFNGQFGGEFCELFFNFTTKEELEDKNNGFLIDNNLKIHFEIIEVEEVTDSENNMKRNFGTLLKTGNFSDVIFVVENKELYAHKAIICARSPVFAGMFSSDCKENNENQVNIHDVPVKVFEELLQFMYTNQITQVGKYATELLMAADKYQVDDLKLKCIQYFIKKTTVKNAIEQLILADLVSSENLKSHCIKYICDNADCVIKTESWKSMKNDAKTYAHLLAELFEVFANYIKSDD